ncbi:MAG TPA: 2-oxoacid:acceptor oxidoreductase subunit alpha [bacterium]
MPVTDDISVVLCGAAGQGLDTVEQLLARVLNDSGFNVFSTKEFMSRIRGGINSTSIRVSSKPVRAPLDRIDIFIPFNEKAFGHVEKRLTSRTLIISEYATGGLKSTDVPFSKLASEIGSPVYANIIGVGLISGLCGAPLDIIHKNLKYRFSSKGAEIISKNNDAARRGYEIGLEIIRAGNAEIQITPGHRAANDRVMDGNEAVALGALAGGCNFIAAYPMTPSSGVWTYYTRASRYCDIISEQSEDEISAMNMALGAWYAGARAMITTSGGGFDLMTEGLSLAGAQEQPLVIHLAQRPGPATGLPTRTEQADLDLALYAGHGEFPRIILAPGTPEQAFSTTRDAFAIADQYQVPVFILTDQFLMDSSTNVAALDLAEPAADPFIVPTEPDYRRYQLTANGISPRGIPGHGTGLVIADCHSHDESGHISEDLEIRNLMVDKLRRKAAAIEHDFYEPEYYGGNKDDPCDVLVICWGSNFGVVREAIRDQQLSGRNIGMLHFQQLHPLPSSTAAYLQKAKKVIAIENNATAQFARHIKQSLGFDFHSTILKYNGLPFTLEEVAGRLRSAVEQ